MRSNNNNNNNNNNDNNMLAYKAPVCQKTSEAPSKAVYRSDFHEKLHN